MKKKPTKKTSIKARADEKIKGLFICNIVITFLVFLFYFNIEKTKGYVPLDSSVSGIIFGTCATLLTVQSISVALYYKFRSTVFFYTTQSIGIPVMFFTLSSFVLWGLSTEAILSHLSPKQVTLFLIVTIVSQFILSVWLFFKSTWYRRTIYALSNEKHHAYDIITKKLNPFGFNGAFIEEYSRNRYWLVAMPMAGFLAYGVVSLFFPGWGKILLVYTASFLITFGGVGLAMQGITSYLFVRKIEKRYNIRFVVGEVKFPATRTLPDEGRQPE